MIRIDSFLFPQIENLVWQNILHAERSSSLCYLPDTGNVILRVINNRLQNTSNLPIQTPLGIWLGLGTQSHYKPPDDLWLKN